MVQVPYLQLEVLIVTYGRKTHPSFICINYHQYTCLLLYRTVYGVGWLMHVVCTFPIYVILF